MNNQEHIYLSKFSEWLIIKGYTSKTIHTFCRTAKRFIDWLDEQNIEIENASYNDLVAYVGYQKKRENKQRTIQININIIKHFYNFLQSEELVSENPASNVLIRGIKRKTLQEILSPEELENIYKSFNAEKRAYQKTQRVPPQANNELARKRNKIILGLLIYQGMRTEELGKLELQDLQLREGKINIQAAKKYDARILKLEAHQVYDIMDYVHGTRKAILQATGKNTGKVFISVGTSLNFSNIMQKLVKEIQRISSKSLPAGRQVKDMKQIRTSIISNWLKVHNLRRVQYMAGHRYVSSTEAYQLNNLEDLQDDIRKYHPIG